MNTDKIKLRFCLSVSLCVHLWLTFCSFAADFTVTDQPAGPAMVGFGAQMNPYLYSAPNWGDVTEENVKDFERKVIALKPQHVRIFYLQRWFKGEADVISKGDPRTAESFIRACQLAQRAGASINVTNWYGPWVEPEKQMQEFAATLEELVKQRGLTAIRYVTVQNEPNLHEDKIKKDLYTNLYRALDAALKERGLREQIQIVCGDLVQDNQRDWFAHIGQTLADVSDGYSIHVYWDYWDTAKLVRRISEVPPIVQALPADQQRPLFVMEFGVRGHRDVPRNEPGKHDDGTPIADKPLQAMELAWFMMEGLNRGYVSFVVWTLEDAWYDRFMPYGMIGGVKDGWPLKPSYHMLRLFTHTTQPGWRALKIDGDADGKLVSATRGPDGDLTVYALNQTDKPTTVTIAGLPGGTFHETPWNHERTRTFELREDGVCTIELPPLAMSALTTFPVKLTAP